MRKFLFKVDGQVYEAVMLNKNINSLILISNGHIRDILSSREIDLLKEAYVNISKNLNCDWIEEVKYV